MTTPAIVLPLSTSVSVALGPAGTGSGVLGPVPIARRWRVAALVASGASVLVPVLRVYRNTAEVYNFIDGTASANSDTGDYSGLVVNAGEIIMAVWTGGTSGAQMILQATGTIESSP